MAKSAKKSKAKAPQAAKKKKDADSPAIKMITDNRKARHNFHILEILQSGIELTGTEVKAARQGKANLTDAYARIEGAELWLFNCHISEYTFGNRFNHEPLRKRKLLVHKNEIYKLGSKMKEQGLTLVPLRMYFKKNWIKVDLALAKGKQLYDKRETIQKREVKRELDRLVKRARS